MSAPLVICGPSGVGKSVLIKYLRRRFPDKFGFTVSHTTRAPRPGEKHGIDYYFSNHEAMQQMVDEGKFAEHAEVHGNLYGTSKEAIESVLMSGKICILDIDVQGAKRLHEEQHFGHGKFIFINPPSKQELEKRLRGRGTESEEQVQKRLAAAISEMDFAASVGFFDHKFILNGMSETTTPTEVHDLCNLLASWFPFLRPRSTLPALTSDIPPIASQVSGLLWKQSPSPLKFGKMQLRWVDVGEGKLKWSLPGKTGDQKGEEKGEIDFCVQRCILEEVEGSDSKFVLRPAGDHWENDGRFTRAGHPRIFVFDASGSPEGRERWLTAIEQNMRIGQSGVTSAPAALGVVNVLKSSMMETLGLVKQTGEEIDQLKNKSDVMASSSSNFAESVKALKARQEAKQQGGWF